MSEDSAGNGARVACVVCGTELFTPAAERCHKCVVLQLSQSKVQTVTSDVTADDTVSVTTPQSSSTATQASNQTVAQTSLFTLPAAAATPVGRPQPLDQTHVNQPGSSLQGEKLEENSDSAKQAPGTGAAPTGVADTHDHSPSEEFYDAQETWPQGPRAVPLYSVLPPYAHAYSAIPPFGLLPRGLMSLTAPTNSQYYQYGLQYTHSDYPVSAPMSFRPYGTSVDAQTHYFPSLPMPSMATSHPARMTAPYQSEALYTQGNLQFFLPHGNFRPGHPASAELASSFQLPTSSMHRMYWPAAPLSQDTGAALFTSQQETHQNSEQNETKPPGLTGDLTPESQALQFPQSSNSEQGTPYLKSKEEKHLFPGTKGRKGKDDGGQQKKEDTPQETRDTSKSPREHFCKPTSHLRGLSAGRCKSIAVTFHAIVPLNYWEWDDTSCMHIRFGHTDLGNWKENCGVFRKIRDLGRGLCLMTCTLEIDAKILKDHAIPYKYVIFSSKMEKPHECYEFLHSHGRDDPNRCLLVSIGRNGSGTYNCYDKVIYPKKTETARRWYEKGYKLVKEAFGQSKEIEVMAETEMNRICLQIYLQDLKQLLSTGDFGPGFDVAVTVEELVHIFHCVSKTSVYYQDSRGREVSFDHGVRQHMLGWIEEITKAQDVTDTRKKLVSAVCLICGLTRMNFDPKRISPDFALHLLPMLFCRVENETCPDYSYLCEVLPQHYRKTAVDGMKLILNAMKTKVAAGYQHFDKCFLALPLLHFLQGDSKPFGSLELEPARIVFKSEVLTVNPDTYDKHSGFVAKYYPVLQSLNVFQLDPILLPLFVGLCPNQDTLSLIEVIPVGLSITWLSVRAYRVSSLNKTEVKTWSEQLEKATTALKAEVIEHEARLKSNLDATMLLFKHLLSKLKEPFYTDLLKLCISLILFAMSKIIVHRPDACEQKIASTLAEMKGLLGNWFADKKVIGGSIFGGYVPTSSQSSKASQEIELWQAILGLDCPVEVEEKWQDVARSIIGKRVFGTGLTDDFRIDLLYKVNNLDVLHSVLVEVLMDAATNAIDRVCTKSWEVAAGHMTRLAETKSIHVGHLLGTVLKKKYQELKSGHPSFELTLAQLLEWSMWPHFVRIYGSDSVLKEGLSVECQSACLCALTKLQEVSKDIESGNITVETLNELSPHEEKFKTLCVAAKLHCADGVENRGILYHLGLRKAELDEFSKQKSCLLNLVTHLNISGVDRTISGVSELQGKLTQNYENCPINCLCVTTEAKVQLLLFDSAQSLMRLAKNFELMTKVHLNDLFGNAWKKQLSIATRTVDDLALDGIEEHVFQPTLDECIRLIDNCYELTLSLSSVNDLFSGYNSQQLTTQLESLARGINACTSQTELKDLSWIGERVKRIQDYWQLRRYRQAASTMLELRNALHLEQGDFSSIERLASKLGVIPEEWTLGDINQSLISAGQFLDKLTQPSRLECLQEYARCQDVVSWIKDVGKGATHTLTQIQGNSSDVGDLQSFVDVALSTGAGGEDAYTHDRLSQLKVVGSEFGPLIYQLPGDAGFHDLAKQCEAVWEALEKNPQLPTMLAQCNGHLDWFKSLKKAQGSVEICSYEQMKEILEYGYFLVGSSKEQTFSSIYEAIQLTVDGSCDKKSLSKTRYSLDELRDLESKLVLITGTKAEHRHQVDQYLDTLHSVCHIAEDLLALQDAGNVKYTRWVFKLQCKPNMVAELQNLHKEMKQELCDWIDTVKKARDEFYELNYFTTQQLLVLRKELCRHKQSRDSFQRCSVQVLTLLHSVSEAIDEHVEVIEDVVCETTGEFTCSDPACDSENQHGLSSHTSELRPRSLAADILSSVDTSMHHQTFSTEHLTDKQKDLLTEYISIGFSKDLVMMALKECGENESKIVEWCERQEAAYQGAESEDEQEPDIDTDDSSSEGSEPELTYGTPDLPKSDTVEKKSPKIVYIERQAIDAFHPMVEQLSSASLGYSLDDSIEAVESCGHSCTLQEAMDYLMTKDAEDPVFHSSAVTCSDSEESKQDYAESSVGAEGSTITTDGRAEEEYLSLRELGTVLRKLGEKLPAAVTHQRPFPNFLTPDGAQLLMVSPDMVLQTTLAIYMGTDAQTEICPLPTLEEVLVCNENTTAEEVSLLWRRAVDDPGYKRIFCLVHAEKLTYQVSDTVVQSLTELTQGRADPFRLVIICNNEHSGKSNIVSKLQNIQKTFGCPYKKTDFQKYLSTRFQNDADETSGLLMASCVDKDKSCVRVIVSTRAGMGKSLYVRRMAEELHQQRGSESPSCITIPLHGPSVSADSIMRLLNKHTSFISTILHIDIAVDVLHCVDTIIFSLIILRGLTDSHGSIWRCHPSQLCAIEVTMQERRQRLLEIPTRTLISLFPTVYCATPRKTLKIMTANPGEHLDPDTVLMDQLECESGEYQRVYQYLLSHEEVGSLDDSLKSSPHNCLETILRYCGIEDPSWSEIRHFVAFLDVQLQSCEKSIFCDEKLVGDVMSGLKEFVVKFMITMSRDFATPSISGEVQRRDLEKDELVEELYEDLEQYEIVRRRQWEQSIHPYIFFNEDRVSITFVGFMITKNGDLVDPSQDRVIESNIMSKSLHCGLTVNKVNLNENCLKWTKKTMMEKLAAVMGVELLYDPDESYVLTVDNVIKILAIYMRFRCGIPVVIMGETGCGKTRLIRFMCELARQGTDSTNLLILKMHGGTTEEDIEEFIAKAQEIAEENAENKVSTVVFFDEANTSDAIGLIKEIMCDRRLHGIKVSGNLKFIAACNPYRKHTQEMIDRLDAAGLGFYVKTTDKLQRLGKIPLRQLVYRVLDLPPSMQPHVYDFGQLRNDTETNYIWQIINNHVKKHEVLRQKSQKLPGFVDVVTRVLAACQMYMRQKDDECSFVSLRDVERAMIVFEYFLDKMHILGPRIDAKTVASEEQGSEGDEIEEEEADASDDGSEEEVVAKEKAEGDPGVCESRNLDEACRSLILAVSICYHARLWDRTDFEKMIVSEFQYPLEIQGGVSRFRNEIRWCQEVLLDGMTLSRNIARNAALRENVFMMAVCIELKIPLFLVGKPGSSKSLAKSIVATSMQGSSSKSELMKEFKQVQLFSYQCSQLSTPKSVIEVFTAASKFQNSLDTEKYVSVVVLDEVGLAEDSPNLPLKALHPLLEDGTEGEGYSQQVVEREKRVAFIGISNWALDPAKMNRGVMVTRGNPDVEELELSARGICSVTEDDPVLERLDSYFLPLADAFIAVCQKQKREFFGLRDFYSLIKMLYWLCEKTKLPPTGLQLEHAIRRNFGGLDPSETFDPVKEFTSRIDMSSQPDLSHFPPELRTVLSPDCTELGMIRASLSTRETSWHGENRYLLFLTENYAALDILRHYLLKDVGHSVATSATGGTAQTCALPEEMEPFILFGSSFPKDKEYTQVCRNINQIKICMETGRTVILLNLENLYESLYDVLNQYYVYLGNQRYVDLGLQTHRVKCRVHKHFKLILIAEKSTVYEKFPTPLINRLEKHFVLTSSVLNESQLEVLHELKDWTKNFSCVPERDGTRMFKESDAFIGYQEDSAAAVVFQATSLLEKHHKSRKVETALQSDLLAQVNIDTMSEDLEAWKQAVLLLSQYLLLYTAPPDALIRLDSTPLAGQMDILVKTYMECQHHKSLQDFLSFQLLQEDSQPGLLLQVTTHSHLLSSYELEQLGRDLNLTKSQISCFVLQEFDTELDFSNKVGPAFKREKDDEQNHLVIIQCDSGNMENDLIACARYRIFDQRFSSSLRTVGKTHVLFIIHLPVHVATMFVGFLGEPWVSTHIDDLRTPTDSTLTLDQAMGVSISELFYRKPVQVEAQHHGNADDSVGPSTEPPHILRESSTEEGSDGDHSSNDDSTEDEECAEETSATSSLEFETVESIPLHSTFVDSMQLSSNIPGFSERELTFASDQTPPVPQHTDTSAEASQHTDKLAKDSQRTDVPAETECTNVKKELVVNQGFCSNLHHCIQAAASKIQDSDTQRTTGRLPILTTLIPKTLASSVDDSTFYGILVKHIHCVLLEREAELDETNWLLSEAKDRRKLQTGGTIRSVIARRIEALVVPILTEIIAFVDRNYNLDLLWNSDKKCLIPQSHPIFQFWLAMFREQRVVRFQFKEIMESAGRLGGPDSAAGEQMPEEPFSCKLPFSWLICKAFEAQWINAKSSKAHSEQDKHEQLCTLISETPIFSILTVGDTECEELYRNYLYDFVRIVHQCHHKEATMEYELISSALHNMIVHSPDFATKDGHMTLTSRIAAVHVAYHSCEEKVFWFGQLTSHFPSILRHLNTTVFPDTQEMVLHQYAVQRALERLKPPLDPREANDTEELKHWLSSMRRAQTAVSSILTLPSEDDVFRRCARRWHNHLAIRFFIEHIVLHYEGMIPFAKRLQKYLGDEPDFLEESTVTKVKKVLNALKPNQKKRDFKKSCHAFFMEVVSSLCFGCHEAPTLGLTKMLMDTIFTEKPKELEEEEREGGIHTSALTYAQTRGRDVVPVIRSFLLQLLLEHNDELVRDFIREYFDKCCRAVGGGTSVDQNLFLLLIQCFEDSLFKASSVKQLKEVMISANDLLIDGHQALVQFPNESLEYVEGVAKIRFALSMAAQLINKQICIADSSDVPQYCYGAHAEFLLQSARDLCTDQRVCRQQTGPAVYLLKLLVRRYGMHRFQSIIQSSDHTWILPEELQLRQNETAVDPFVIYGPEYYKLRETVRTSIFEGSTEQLVERCQVLLPPEVPTFLFALRANVSLTLHGTEQASEQLTIEDLEQFIAGCESLGTEEWQQLARVLLRIDVAQVDVTPSHISLNNTLGVIVVHAVAVLTCKHRKCGFLQPFDKLLRDPSFLVGALLPTMPEDVLAEIRQAVYRDTDEQGVFYECRNGHPYYVGECGRPYQQAECSICHTTIGGVNHVLVHDNRLARANDTTQTGHCLGPPELRSDVPAPERALSPASCCIMRILMHSCLLWTSTHNENSTHGVRQLVQGYTNPEFFWKHLEKDLNVLAQAIGRNVDECAVLVHLVLKGVLTKDPPEYVGCGILRDKRSRNEWEERFDQTYIQPVVKKLDSSIEEAMHLMHQDDKGERDQLYCVVYERTSRAKEHIEPHLWSYRDRITLDHLTQTLQQQTMKENCPILYQFLQQEHNLRATKYLADIVKLQRLLCDRYHHRLGRREAHVISVRHFLEDAFRSRELRSEYEEMFSSMQAAWSLVRDQLKSHGRLRIDDEYLLESMSEDTPLEYLIPTPNGAGACSMALADFLMDTHNNFIETCRRILRDRENSRVPRKEKKLPLHQVRRCHLIDYESHILSVVLSHCHYSLTLGKGQKISYDLPALEKHILDRFIHGKPLILSNIPQVVYRRDVCTAATFAEIRSKVAPQTLLESHVKKEILSELHTPAQLRQNLDVVDIVLGFVSTGGGQAERSLGVYIERTLKMRGRFSDKGREHCNLGHVLSLWRVLTTELAKKAAINGQEPFDTLTPDFLEELEEVQVEELERCLRVFDLEFFLEVLCEFIETDLKYSPTANKDWPLPIVLKEYANRYDIPNVPELCEELPQSTTLAQTAAVWKYTATFIVKQNSGQM